MIPGAQTLAMIPVSDLVDQYHSIQGEINEAAIRILASGEFERGEELWALESEIAAYCGVRRAIGVGSGYASLFLALRALDIGPGDEVITVANTDITTCSAISHCGATIVWVDVDERTFNMDPDRVQTLIGPRTRAIIAVHLYGLPADVAQLRRIADDHHLALIEDAALAFGATVQGRRVGSFGDITCLSFAPHKVLGAYGDGGMILTDRSDLADRIRVLAGYGEPWKESMAGPDGRLSLLVEGYHSHLDLLQAAILRVKLRHVDNWITARQNRAELYSLLLAGTDAVVPYVPPDRTHVFRNYVIRVRHRDQVRRALADRRIDTALLYLPPLHLQPVYCAYGRSAGSYPITERLADELLCLPLYPELQEKEVHHIAREVRSAMTVAQH